MKRILIAEDDAIYLSLLTAALERYRDRFEVLTAENGRKAMDLLKQTRDEIVREGKGEVWFYDGPRKVEFDDCRNCHPSREDFCNRCHKPVNLYLGITCFRCHEY